MFASKGSLSSSSSLIGGAPAVVLMPMPMRRRMAFVCSSMALIASSSARHFCSSASKVSWRCRAFFCRRSFSNGPKDATLRRSLPWSTWPAFNTNRIQSRAMSVAKSSSDLATAHAHVVPQRPSDNGGSVTAGAWRAPAVCAPSFWCSVAGAGTISFAELAAGSSPSGGLSGWTYDSPTCTCMLRKSKKDPTPDPASISSSMKELQFSASHKAPPRPAGFLQTVMSVCCSWSLTDPAYRLILLD
mmetsp:Transcript_17782/g.48793  ORF Transcript_17782/g.48793 Transcript_17782/m.48793 type:complete len:244 (-) Transcript_17782:3516-4247(-)